MYDLGSKGGTAVNGTPVTEQAPLKLGDTLTLGGVPLVFLPQTVGEREELEKKRQAERPAAMWPSFLWLTVFQILTAIQLTLAAGEKASPVIPICFLTLTVVMWLYAAALRLGRCVGFELETIAFYLSTLSLAVTASSAPGSLPKQLLAIVLAWACFWRWGYSCGIWNGWKSAAGSWLPGPSACWGSRWCWARLNSARPTGSPWAVYPSSPRRSPRSAIFCSSATLERLFRRRNLALFIVLTGVCIGLLGLMSDFGTAAIFFVTFLVIAYLRSGDAATLALICGGAAFGAGIIVQFKPYILSRFAAWGHAWEAASGSGYQQTRTMSAAASGGLLGMGAGNGWLHKLPRQTRTWCSACSARNGDCSLRCWRWYASLPWLFCRPGGPGGAVQLLYHCRLCGRIAAGVPDVAECVRLRGSSATHRRDLPLRVQRRLRHAVGMGAAGVSKGHGHPCGCQLCHRSGGGAEAGRGSRPYGGTGRGCL